jgi:hypothetical protein
MRPMAFLVSLFLAISLGFLSLNTAFAKDVHLKCDVAADWVESPSLTNKGKTREVFEIVFDDEKNIVRSVSRNISFACAGLNHMNVVRCDCTVSSDTVGCDSLGFSKSVPDSKEEAWIRINRFSGRLTGTKSMGTEKSSTVLVLEGVCEVFTKRKF